MDSPAEFFPNEETTRAKGLLLRIGKLLGELGEQEELSKKVELSSIIREFEDNDMGNILGKTERQLSQKLLNEAKEYLRDCGYTRISLKKGNVIRRFHNVIKRITTKE